MEFKSFINDIKKGKQLSLFGEVSHAKLSPPFRLKLAKKMKEKAKFAKQAAVIVLFYPNKNQNTNLVLILRKTYKGVHSAQVGFPGGKYEDNDNDLMATALRETEEEIGIEEKSIEVLKKLSPIYIPPSNFMVHPYFAISQQPLTFKKEEEEVEEIIEVALSDFLNDANLIKTKVETSYNVKVEVPAFQLNGYVIWGATAMILSEVKDLLKQIL